MANKDKDEKNGLTLEELKQRKPGWEVQQYPHGRDHVRIIITKRPPDKK